MDRRVRGDVTLWLLFASAASGTVTGLTLGIVAVIEAPLGPAGDLVAVLAFCSLLGLILAGPYALVCGGLLRLLIRARGLQRAATPIFLVAGAIAGTMFVPLTIIATDGAWRPVPFVPLLMAAFSGLCGTLAYLFLMPPIQTREH